MTLVACADPSAHPASERDDFAPLPAIHQRTILRPTDPTNRVDRNGSRCALLRIVEGSAFFPATERDRIVHASAFSRCDHSRRFPRLLLFRCRASRSLPMTDNQQDAHGIFELISGDGIMRAPKSGTCASVSEIGGVSITRMIFSPASSSYETSNRTKQEAA